MDIHNHIVGNWGVVLFYDYFFISMYLYFYNVSVYFNIYFLKKLRYKAPKIYSCNIENGWPK